MAKQEEKGMTMYQSEELLQLLVDNLDAIMAVLGSDQTIRYVNPSIKEILGYTAQQMVEKSILHFVHPDETSKVLNSLSVLTKKPGESVALRHRLRHLDGSWRFFETKGRSLHDSKGRPLTILISHPAPPSPQEGQKLKEQEERFQALIDHSHEIIGIISQDGTITYKSPSITAVMGYEPSELVGRNAFELFHPEEHQAIREGLVHIVETPGASAVTEMRYRHKSGAWRWIEARISNLLDHPAVNGIVINYSDITDRKNTGEILRKSEAKLWSVLETVPDFIMQIDAAGTVEFINHVLPGLALEHIIGAKLYDFLLASEHGRTKEMIAEVLRSGEPAEIEVASNILGERSLVYACRIAPVKDTEGIGALTVVARDITERRKAQEEILLQKTRFEQLFRNAPLGIAIMDGQDRIIDVNRAFEEIFGYSLEEARGRTINELVLPPEHALEGAGLSATTFRGEIAVAETRRRRKDGTLVDVRILGVPIAAEGSLTGIYGIYEDISKRKRSEEELKRSEQRYRSFFEDDLTGDYTATAGGRLLSCNPAFLRIFSFVSVEEALRRNLREFFRNGADFESLLMKLTGEKKLEYQEIELLHPDGRTLYMVANLTGKFNEKGDLVEIKGYLFDDTKRRELEMQLIQAQKLESLGTLAGGIAHDFNNILAIIMGHSSLLDKYRTEPEKTTQSIDAIRRATKRGASLVRQLLTFARKSEAYFESVNINDVVKEITKLLNETIPKTITVTTRFGADIPLITADATQIHQVFLNLCVNARDAMPKGGEIIISTGVVQGETLEAHVPKTAAHQYVSIDVSDTGTGMDKTTLSRIFEPFFTTKKVGAGTGLGLAVVFGIIETHQGSIEVESEPGKGTTFHLYFPVPRRTPEEAGEASEGAEEVQGGNETILVVEDEEMLRDLVDTTLTSKGYSVLLAADGQEAIDLYVRHQEKIAAVLSDIGLPKLSGDEVYKRLKQINPYIKIVLASGFIEAEIRAELAGIGAKHFIQKPYQSDQILSTLRAVIDNP